MIEVPKILMKQTSSLLAHFFSQLRSSYPLFGFLGICGASLLLSGCETPGQSALAGAGTGAVMGGMLKGTGRGMAQGAAIGAAGGYVLGAYGQSERNRGYAQASGAYPPPSAPVYYAPPPQPRYYGHRHTVVRAEPLVYGRQSGRYGFVYSPYGRRELVDVRGLSHGASVVDPFCGRIFLNP